MKKDLDAGNGVSRNGGAYRRVRDHAPGAGI